VLWLHTHLLVHITSLWLVDCTLAICCEKCQVPTYLSQKMSLKTAKFPPRPTHLPRCVSGGSWLYYWHLLSVTTIVFDKSFQGCSLRVTVRSSYNNELIPYVFSFSSPLLKQQLPRFRHSSFSTEVLGEIKTEKRRQKFSAHCVPCMFTVCTAAWE
jgi:hypothetical protein